MNLLSAVMPGIREVRTPLATGVLWLLFAYLVTAPRAAQIVAENDVLAALSATVSTIPTVYVVGALAFIAYLLGAAMLPLSSTFARVVLWPLVRERNRSAKYKSLRGRFQWFLRRTVDVSDYRTPLMDAVNRVYVEQGVSANLALTYPVELVVSRLDETALQLWNKAPTQYQEYDRLRAESSFRVGVAFPLLGVGAALSVALGFGSWWWLAAVSVLFAIVFIIQSERIDHRRKVLMANALYQGLVEDIHLKSVAAELNKVTYPRKGEVSESLLCAATAVAMHRIGDYEGANTMVWAAADEVGEYLEGGESVDEVKARLEQITSAVHELLEENDAGEYVWVFDRQMEKHADVAAAE